MPGDDPHTHLEMPFMRAPIPPIESGTPRRWLAEPLWWSISPCRSGQGLTRCKWDNKSTRANCDYSFHMAVTW
jgi:dihydropyrimidinase